MDINRGVYIVTGASKGFGFAIAEGLVAKGAKVGLISRTQADLDDAIQKLGAESTYGIAVDVADSNAITNALVAIKDHFGRLDGLINNAGVARPNKIEKLIDEEVLLQINTNLLGTIYACRSVIPLLRDSDNPRVINISSATVAHHDEASHMSIYGAVKAAVERFSRELATELEEDRIGVSIVRPGSAATDIANGWNDEATIASFEAWKDVGAYMRTGMEPTEVADAVIYALGQPRGVAADLIEIRPHIRTNKY